MARQLRVEYPGAIYHVTCRMVGDAAKGGASWPLEKRLFRDDAANRLTHLQASGAGDWALAYNPTNCMPPSSAGDSG